MELLSLVTTNFKKLGNFSCEFTKGLNVIAGDNAQGKSTTLQAIEAALFGVTVVPGKKENIPTWGQTKFSLVLRFKLAPGNEFYELTRTGTTAKLIRNWLVQVGEIKEPEIVANGSTPVTAMVEQLLGLSAKDWNLFVQSKQGSSAGILDFGAAALNRKVEEFAGVDLIDKVQAEAQRMAVQNTSYADANTVSEEYIAQAGAEQQAASEARQLASFNVEAAEVDLNGHGEFTLEKPPSTDAMRQAIRDVDTLSNKIEVAEVQVANGTKRVAEAAARVEGKKEQDADALREELDEAKAMGISLATVEKQLQQEADHRKAVQQDTDESDLTLNTRQVEFVANWAEFDEDELQAEITLLDKAIPAAETDLAARQEEVGKAKAAYDNLVMLSDGAVCPTCNRAKEDHDPVKLAAEAEEARVYRENRKASVVELQEKINASKTRRTALQDKLAAYNKAAAAVDSAAEGLKENTAALAALRGAAVIQSELDEATEKLTASREAYAELQAKIKGVNAANEQLAADRRALNTAEEELLMAQQDLERFNADLEALPEPPTDEELAAAVKAEADFQLAQTNFNSEKQRLTFAVTEAKSALKFAEQALANAEGKCQQHKEAAVKALEFLTTAKKYSRLVQFLRDRRQAYLKEVWDTIMGVSSKLVRTASKDTITAISNDEGEFFYVEDGTLAPTASASGAQKAMIGVSLRVGLARALYGKDSLLSFDEPTESCREHNAASLAAMIAGSAKQVLLITHRETDQALAENIINVGV
ncbi:DNA repair exonuclease [Pseudomonas phage PMBT3]|uniref:DNA repair exonuclease n=1 Tax=Pseudomonas phage PMBT3 TaxID=2059856 RepID=A0A2I6PHV9_9CAUD|nr:DNA repair exonuclease [Pseudomonas phage PMBT3]AUM59640.1 DNA repair exonuclease [Pseudomonas phage PMBT3]